MNYLTLVCNSVASFFKDHLKNVSAHTLGWIAIVLLFFSNVPTLIAVLLGKSDTLPPVDIVIFLFAGLIALFFKALIEKNFLYIATICMGFAAQAVLMSLTFLK